MEGQVKLLVLDAASGHKQGDPTTKGNWNLARGVTAAAAAAARVRGAVGNLKARMAESAAASQAAAAGAAQGGDWGAQQGNEAASDDDGASSGAADWE